MSEKLRIQCCDMPSGLRYGTYLFKLLERAYDLEISDDPEIVLYGPYGLDFLRYRCLRIYHTGENTRPNFKQCDYAFSFDYSDNPRNYRFPGYAGYADVRQLTQPKDVEAIMRAKNGFCSFMCSNPVPQARIRFFRMLSKYKRVDSFGRVLNNMKAAEAPEEVRSAGWQDAKLRLTERYKFAIAFENASRPGYVTEKILHAMLCNSIPIYWGSPQIDQDFNSRSFINCHQYRNFDEVVQRVIEVDSDDSLYRAMLAEPWYVDNRVPEAVAEENVLARLRDIVDRRHEVVPVAQRYLRSTRREIQGSLLKPQDRLGKLVEKLKFEYYSRRYIR